MNVGELITRAERLAARVDAGFDSRTLQFLNEGVDKWARSMPWPTLRKIVRVVADGTRNLMFPPHVFQVVWLADESNKEALEHRDQWEKQDPSSYLGDSTGAATWWREIGVSPVSSQPSSLSQLTVRTTVSDNFSVHIAGVSIDTTQSGTANYEYFAEEQVNITGSGPQTSANSYLRIMTIGKDDITPGDLLVTVGSTQLARVAKNRYRAEYRNVEFLAIPPAGTLIRAGILERPGPLVSNYQQPHPSIDPEFLVWFAAGLIHKAMNEGELFLACDAKANEILTSRISKEKTHGEEEVQSYPDPAYWNYEDRHTWP